MDLMNTKTKIKKINVWVDCISAGVQRAVNTVATEDIICIELL